MLRIRKFGENRSGYDAALWNCYFSARLRRNRFSPRFVSALGDQQCFPIGRRLAVSRFRRRSRRNKSANSKRDRRSRIGERPLLAYRASDLRSMLPHRFIRSERSTARALAGGFAVLRALRSEPSLRTCCGIPQQVLRRIPPARRSGPAPRTRVRRTRSRRPFRERT